MLYTENVEGIMMSALNARTAKKHPMRIEGHRGAGHMELENSLKAFQKAIDLGIDGVEFDVWLTKDNVPVVVHGHAGGVVEFEGSCEGVINQIDYDTLKLLTLRNGEKIPTLVEVLDTCKDKVHMNIEIKELREEVIDTVLALLEERNLFDQITFSSFNHYLRQRLTNEVVERKIPAQVNFGFLMEIEEPKFPDYLTTQPGDSINVDIRYLEQNREACLAEIRRAQEKGVKVKFWFPMEYADEHMYYDDLLNLEVDTIITNKPLMMIEYFGKFGQACV
jgi:glycerophosphoryl diester phosphodiesterase